MEKVQVDARKLQLLNDRINQTIDALAQVRASVAQAGLVPGSFVGAGLSHTSYVPGYTPSAWQFGGVPGAVSPYIGMGGLAHSTLRSPVAELAFGIQDPSLRQLELQRAFEANRAWEISQGLMHTTLPLGVTPYGAQMPYGSFAQNPIVIS